MQTLTLKDLSKMYVDMLCVAIAGTVESCINIAPVLGSAIPVGNCTLAFTSTMSTFLDVQIVPKNILEKAVSCTMSLLAGEPVLVYEN
jgi:hypothetical protein